MLNMNTVKSYSFHIPSLCIDDFCEFVSTFEIDLGDHDIEDVWYMSDAWPYLEYDKDFGWGITITPSMQLVPDNILDFYKRGEKCNEDTNGVCE
jgi:hypothetical protein